MKKKIYASLALVGLCFGMGTAVALTSAIPGSQIQMNQGQFALELDRSIAHLQIQIFNSAGQNEVLYQGSANAGVLKLNSKLWESVQSTATFIRIEADGHQMVQRLNSQQFILNLPKLLALSAGGDCSTLSSWQVKSYAAGDQVTEGGNIYECKAYPYNGWCGLSTSYKPESGFAWADAWTKIGACGGTSSQALSSSVLSSSAALSSVAVSSVSLSSSALSSAALSSSAVLSSSSAALSSSAVLSSSASVISCSSYANWKSTTSYAVGTIIQYSGKAYKCLVANKNKTPSNNPSYWALQGTCGTLSSSSALSSSVGTSSSSTCNAVVVSGYNFNITNASTTASGYQQNNYTVFSAGDQVIVEGRSCSEAVTIAAQPAGDTWNLYFTTGYPGLSGTNVRLAKVRGTVASSSSVLSSSSTTLSSSAVVSSSSVVANGTPVNQLITKAQFDAMFPNRGTSSCLSDGANTVYTYENFISAAGSFALFAQEGTDEQRKREIAAFLGQTSHETTGGGGSWCGGTADPNSACFQWGLCYTEEVGCNDGTCTQYNDTKNTTYPVVSGHSYHGRGPIQLSWNYNYGPASLALYGDKMVLLNNPDLVKNDGVVAFKTAMWFWMTSQSPKPSSHDIILEKITTSQVNNRPVGYGLITNVINGGIECGNTTNVSKQDDRVNFFKNHAAKLGVSAKPSTSTLTDAQYFYCTTQASF